MLDPGYNVTILCGMRFKMAEHVLTSILAEAAATPHQEICGLLFGDLERIDTAQSVANVAADPRCTFEIDPAALFAALRTERAGGARLIGCYHSHPNGLAKPSNADAAAAEPDKLWLIMGSGVARLWWSGKDGFTEAQLDVTT